jgi:hypothetical protein
MRRAIRSTGRVTALIGLPLVAVLTCIIANTDRPVFQKPAFSLAPPQQQSR